MMRLKLLTSQILTALLFSFSCVIANATPPADTAPALTAELSVHNRSGYPMNFALWKNAKECTNRMMLDPSFNINAANAQVLTIPAGNPLALGVAIFEMRDKLPVSCDYIFSFIPKPTKKYSLEYDVRDRQCFSNLYELVNETYQLIPPGESSLTERISILGWDKLEPGCEQE